MNSREITIANIEHRCDERLTATAHSYGMKVIQHTRGYNRELIDDLCDSGIDAFVEAGTWKVGLR